MSVASASDVEAEAPFATRTELLAWLDEHGIAHVARLSLEAAASAIDEALWPELRALGVGRRLLELLSRDALTQSTLPLRFKRLLTPIAAAFLEQERASAERGRASLAARLAPPEQPQAGAVHVMLMMLRATVPPSVAPRERDALLGRALEPDPSLPGFRFEDPHPWQALPRAAGDFVRPHVRLWLVPQAPRAVCSCGAIACVHVLAAIDAALEWSHQPLTEAFIERLTELTRPGWERTLVALESAFAEEESARAGIELTWRLLVIEGVSITVTAWVQKIGKKGQRGAATSMTRRRLLLEHGAKLSAVDARIAGLLPEDDGIASRALLEALLGHPRLVVADAPERPVTVERAAVGLVAEDRHGSVRLTAAIDGAALPSSLTERIRKSQPDQLLFAFDGRRLTLLDVKPELRAALGVLHQQGDMFPSEAQPALLSSLSRWATRLPIAMPRSVLGESVAPKMTPVLRLAAQANGAVHVELLVRPLDGGPALVPGRGARDLHLRRGEQALHAVRDLRTEELLAKSWVGELSLVRAEALPDLPFQFRFPSAHGALELLRECAGRAAPPELEWVGLPIVTHASGGPAMLKVAVVDKTPWFGLLGGLSIEGERVELARLLDAVRRNERFVALGACSYVAIDEALRAHLERLSDHVRSGRHGLELAPSATEAMRALERAGAVLDADAAWSELAARAVTAQALSPTVPRGLETALRPYQELGFQWLARLGEWARGAVLADDMGLGKTVQALALLLHRAERGPALVVVPTSVAFNWRDEAARFAPSLRVVVYAEADDRDATLHALGSRDVLVVSYGMVQRDHERFAGTRFATAVFDEAQNLKNSVSQRFRAAKTIQAAFVVALSGTPIENHLGELWSVFHLVFPALLGSWEAFRSGYASPIEKQLDPNAAPALARVIGPFLLRRTKAEVAPELPPRTDVQVSVVLSPAEWQLYEDARLAALSDLETRTSKMREQERRVDVLAALTRLRLLASHPRLYDERSTVVSSKLERLLELVLELRAEGQRALVFSQFTSHLALVREALEASGIEHLYLDGKTPTRLRGERVREFQEGEAPLFLISLKTGGVGLNLTAASNVIHLDPWWNPAVEDQASDRTHRLGQTQPVTVYRLVAIGTIEEQMLALHARKRALIAKVLAGEAQSEPLSADELLALLAR